MIQRLTLINVKVCPDTTSTLGRSQSGIFFFLHISQEKGKKKQVKMGGFNIAHLIIQRGVAETNRLMQTLDTLIYFDAENKISIYISDVSSCTMRKIS